MALRRTGLFLVVVVVVALLAAASPAAPAAPFLFLGHLDDRVRQLLEREADAALVLVDTDDQQRQLVADRDQLVGAADRTVRHLRDVKEPVHARLQLHEGAEVGEADHLAGNPRAHRVPLGDRGPRIGLDLLEPERDTLVLAIEVQNLRLELLPLLEDLRGMPHVAGPGHVRDVQQPVHARLELDERPEVGEVADAPERPRTGLVALLDRRPRIRLDLLHAQRDPLGAAVDVEHDHLDLVADIDELRGMADPAGPGHLRDVNEPFDTGLELDERAVVGEAHDLAVRLGAGGVRLLDTLPRVRRLLLVAERDAARLAVEVEDDHLDLVTDLEDLRGMADSAPAHVGHVQQPVDPTEIDEGAVVRDVLHGAGEHHALGQHLERVLLLLLALLLEDRAAGEHHVAAAAIELDDLRPDRLAHHGGQVLHRPEVHLRARQERLDPDVDGEAALDDLDHPPLDRRGFLVRLGDRVPNLDLVGLVLREDDEAFGVLLGLEVDLDLLAHLRQHAVPVELLDRDRSLALVTHVHEHLARADVDDTAADDLTLFELGDAGAVPVLHPFLGRVSALPARSAEGLLWFVHHAASSSRPFICFDPRTTRAEVCGHRPWCRRAAARSPSSSRGWQSRIVACDLHRARRRTAAACRT